MSVRVLGRTGPPVIATLGIALLTLRVSFLGLPAGTRVAAFAVLVGTIGAASLLVPASAPSIRRMPRSAVLATGLVAVLAASAVAGPPPGMPSGAWALPLALGAAVAEELVFRRLAYATLARRSETLAVVGTTVAFALIHLPVYGVAALPVDLGAGLLFSWQRWAAGSWTVPAATHAAANLLAVLR